MCRKLSIFCLVLLLASFSLWAFPGRATGSPAARPTDTLAQEALAEALKTGSGTQEEIISIELPASSAVQEATAKAEAGKRLTSEEVSAILAELDAAKADYAALEATSKSKDAAIDSLARENSRLKDESGTKAYIMLDGIMGFADMAPEYGIGLTIGTRLGNSLMLELGADYMIGGTWQDAMDFSLDDFTFRCGIGWMF